LTLMRRLAAVVIAASALHVTGVHAADTALEVLARAGAYVRGAEQAFTSMIADEDYVQQQTFSRRAGGRTQRKSDRRRLQSEMLFLWVSQDTLWLGARNVRRVNGRAVPDSMKRIDELLSATDTPLTRVAKARLLRDHSARFNIGEIQRNFNEPTLALQFADPSRQIHFQFELRGRATVGGRSVHELAYREVDRPTTVTGPNGNLPSNGTLYVDDDGIVVRTELYVKDELNGDDARIRVDYRLDARLGMWVPATMVEQYTQQRLELPPGFTSSQTVEETIDGTASYTNYRRFETSGRLVDPAISP
jgi:hypothetical protein